MAIIIMPNTMSIISSVEICGIPAPNTITFRKASEAYVKGNTLLMSCIYHGICCIGKNTPLRNIIGNIKVIMSICAVSWSFVKDVITMPNPTKLNTPSKSKANTSKILPCMATPKMPMAKAKIITPWIKPRPV